MDINVDLGDEVFDESDEDSHEEPSITLSEKDKKILEKYQDLDVADANDEKEMVQMRQDRREFSERLEEDPQFRAKYLASEAKRREALEDDELNDIIGRLQGGSQDSQDSQDSRNLRNLDIDDSEMDEELVDMLDEYEQKQECSYKKPGVVIQTVHNLTININIS